jgi:tRNA G18 (ribose-2'-O)-methylase SpoU
MARVFLVAPQDFRNLCVVTRTLEVLGHAECHVFDPARLVRDRYGKSRAREARVVSAGAFEKIRWLRVDEPLAFLAAHSGRCVATVATPGALALEAFRFEANDLVVFGSESRGLSPELVAACSTSVTITAAGATQSLNLAVSVGIVLFEARRQSAGGPSALASSTQPDGSR